jgi:transcriptional regulator with XRE-family HTH domain
VAEERQERPAQAAIRRPASGISIDPGRLAWWRESRGWSRQDLSDAVTALSLTDEDDAPLTVTRDAIAKIENGERKPKARTVRALCAALSRVLAPQYDAAGTYTGDTWEPAQAPVSPLDLMPSTTPLTPHEDAMARRLRLSHNRDLRAFAREYGIQYKNPVSQRVYYSRPLRIAYNLLIAGASAEALAAAVAGAVAASAGGPAAGDSLDLDDLDERDSITELDLSARTHNALIRGELPGGHWQPVRTIGELTVCTAAELSAIRNFGLTSLAEVRENLAAAGFALKGEEPASRGTSPDPALLAS